MFIEVWAYKKGSSVGRLHALPALHITGITCDGDNRAEIRISDGTVYITEEERYGKVLRKYTKAYKKAKRAGSGFFGGVIL